MSSRCSRLLIGVLACLVSLGASYSQRAKAGEPIRFCVDTASPVATSGKRLARAVAKTEGVDVVIETFIGKGQGDRAFDAKQFRQMADHRCDLILGFPVDRANPVTPPGVQATKAYAQTGFALVARDKLPGSLEGFDANTNIGVVRSTAPVRYVIAQKNLIIDVFADTDSALDALASKRDAAAMVWQPSLAVYQYSHRQSRKWHTRLMDKPDAAWELVALYGPNGKRAADVFGKGVQKLSNAGKLESLVHPNATADTANDDRGDEAGVTEKNGRRMYTEAQARKGHGVYAQHCAQCHGVQLNGNIAPALKGSAFAGEEMDYTIGPVFTFMVQMMPAGRGGSLTHEEYAQLMAFLLRENGYPAGDTPLSYDEARQSKAPLITQSS